MAAVLGLRSRQALLAVLLVNLLTNPVLNYAGLVAAQFVDWSHGPVWRVLPVVLTAEAVVVIVEWRLLRWSLRGDSRRLLLIALATNAASALAGLVFWV